MSLAPPGAPRSKLAAPLAPLLPRLEFEPEAGALVQGASDTLAAIARLEAGARLTDAVRLAAHALPKREAIWWACMCARGAPDPQTTPADLAALEAAEAWVRRPEEPLRRAAMAAAERAGYRSTEAWAAVGAFWSGGSMAPEGQPPVPPGDHLTGVAIAGAVVLAGVRHKPLAADRRYRKFLAAARDIGNGGAGRIAPEPEGAAGSMA